jgi:hypothetical protein
MPVGVRGQGACVVDPDACLARLLDAAVAGDADGLAEVVGDLVAWLRAGGFPPRDPRAVRP